jgi:hypothetical protein
MDDDATRRRRDWLRIMQDPDQNREWLLQQRLIYGGLIGIGVVMVQQFLNAAALEPTALLCVVAFSIAIPLLSALLMINRQEVFRGSGARSGAVSAVAVLAQLAAFVGVAAGFWHITWIAGVGVLVSALVGLAVYSAGLVQLVQQQHQGDADRQSGRRPDTGTS